VEAAMNVQTDIEQRTAYVVTFMEINDDWFTNPENSMFGANSLIGSFLMRWAFTGEFPDDWSDSRLIYAQGKFTEWLRGAPKPMYLICMN
jgi:hypothetical protein